MTVQKFLRQVPFEKMFKASLLNYPIDEIAIAKYKNKFGKNFSDRYVIEKITGLRREKYKKCWEEMLSLDVVEDKETFAVCGTYKDLDSDGEIEEVYDMFVVHKSDFENYDRNSFLEASTYEEMTERYENSKKHNNLSYSPFGINWDVVLGYSMIQASFQYISKENAAATIFHECTWFGFDFKESCENNKKETEEIKRRVEEVEKEDKDSYISWEEVREELKQSIYKNMSPEEIKEHEKKEAEYEKKCDELMPKILLDNYNASQKIFKDIYKEVFE